MKELPMKIQSFIAHKAVINVFESESDSGFTTYRVVRDDQNIGEITIPFHMLPRFSVGEDGSVVIYAWVRLYVVGKHNVRLLEVDADIHKVWIVGNRLLVETDTDIYLFDSSDFSRIAEYNHSEIIINSSVDERHTMTFRDLSNQDFKMALESFTVEKC